MGGIPQIQQPAAPGVAQQPLGYAADPQSQYLAAALHQMAQSGEQQGSVQGLTGNLLAEALMQHKLQQNQAQGVANQWSMGHPATFSDGSPVTAADIT